MNVAAILERVGFVPVVPTAPEQVGTAPAVAAQRVPTVPMVPTAKGECANEAREAASAGAAMADTRAALLTFVDLLGIDRAHVYRIPGEELGLWARVPADVLPAYLQALDDIATRQAGTAPASDTAPIHCAHCGPVWAHPSVAAALPMVSGWPRALGCPWCHVRKAGGYIPRPRARCQGCRHFTPDRLNPEAGMGSCATGHGTHYPMARHTCADLIPGVRASE